MFLVSAYNKNRINKKIHVIEEKLIILFVNFSLIESDNHALVLKIKEIIRDKMKLDIFFSCSTIDICYTY